MFNRIPVLAVVVLAAGMGACEGRLLDPASPGFGDTAFLQASVADTQGSLLASIRAATAQYQSVDAAIADGYVRLFACTPTEGILYLNRALVDGVLEPTRPEHLIYDELPNGKLHLVGVQYVIPSGVWDAVNASGPVLGEQAFLDRRSIPFGAPFPNYALFAWVWKNNPDGMYVRYNPNVNCL